jgi:hypothetical protein
MVDEFQAFEAGYRRGIFDACNGWPKLLEWEYEESDINEAFFDGYNFTFEKHERKI